MRGLIATIIISEDIQSRTEVVKCGFLEFWEFLEYNLHYFYSRRQSSGLRRGVYVGWFWCIEEASCLLPPFLELAELLPGIRRHNLYNFITCTWWQTQTVSKPVYIVYLRYGTMYGIISLKWIKQCLLFPKEGKHEQALKTRIVYTCM